MAFPADPLDVEVSLALGADLTDPGSWSWTDITSYVRENNRIRIRRGRSSERSTIPPSRCTLVVDNTDGRFCRLNPFGAWYGQIGKNTPIRIRVNNGSGYVTRFVGYVSGWPPSWDPSEQDQTVTLVADGILRRLGQGRTLRSALYRTMAGITEGDFAPVAYWPLEDGSAATQFASAISGHSAATLSGDVNPASYDDIIGSDALPVINDGGRITATVPAYAATSVWQQQFVLTIPSAPASDVNYFDIAVTPGSGSTIRTIRIRYFSPDTVQIAALDSSGADIASNGTSASYGEPLIWAVTQFVDSGNLLTVLGKYNVDGFVSQTNISTAGAVGTVTGLTGYASAVNAGWSPGHWALYTDPAVVTTPNIGPNAAALSAHAGEQAHERVERLCREERVPVTVTATTSQAMGAQRNNTLVALLRECATTDFGLLYEPLDVGLVYVSSSERYNLTPAITLEYDQGHIAPPWDPTDDDLGARNDITASRSGGSSARVTDEASIAAIGVYDDTLSVNTETDEQLDDLAGWALNVGTVDELRWPAVKPNLLKHPSLIDDWLTVDLGSQLHVTGHPSPLAPAEIKQLVEGYDETFGSYEFTVVANLSPASPWVVGVWDTARWAALWSRLESAVDENDTSWSVETDADKLPWVDGSSGPQFPLEIVVGGLVYEVTAISGTSSPQTFTVTRLAQDKAHDAGTPVYVHEPLRWVLPSP